MEAAVANQLDRTLRTMCQPRNCKQGSLTLNPSCNNLLRRYPLVQEAAVLKNYDPSFAMERRPRNCGSILTMKVLDSCKSLPILYQRIERLREAGQTVRD